MRWVRSSRSRGGKSFSFIGEWQCKFDTKLQRFHWNSGKLLGDCRSNWTFPSAVSHLFAPQNPPWSTANTAVSIPPCTHDTTVNSEKARESNGLSNRETISFSHFLNFFLLIVLWIQCGVERYQQQQKKSSFGFTCGRMRNIAARDDKLNTQSFFSFHSWASRSLLMQLFVTRELCERGKHLLRALAQIIELSMCLFEFLFKDNFSTNKKLESRWLSNFHRFIADFLN